MVVVYVIGWGTNGEFSESRKYNIKSITARNLANLIDTGLSWGAGQCGVVMDAKGFNLIEWGWNKTYGGRKIKWDSIPTYVKGWDQFASKKRLQMVKEARGRF